MEHFASSFEGGSVEALHVAVIAGVCGYLVFCISHAFAIWRKRQQASGENARPFPWQLLLGLGGILIAVGWLEREMTRRSGVVLGNDFYVVKAHSSGRPHVLDAFQVDDGDVVVRFDSVELETSYQKLLYDIQIKEREIAILELSVIELNPALLAYKQEAVDDLRATMVQLGLGSGASERGGLDRSIEGFLSVFESVRDDRERQLARIRSLYEKRLISERELEKASEEHMLAERDLNRRRHEIAAALEERKAVVTIKHALALDQERARNKRNEEIEARRAELDKLRQLLIQAERQREVRSPFAGRVVYRHPAPSLADAGQPILAIAAGDGFVARVQIPASEVAWLVQGDSLRLRLRNAIVNEHIMGVLSRTLPVPEQPLLSYLEIVTQLPVEQFANLSYGLVKVDLEWRPPLLSNPFVLAGLALWFMTLFWALVRRMLAWRMDLPIEEGERSVAAEAEPHRFFTDLESQAYAMGIRFGEELDSGSVQVDTLGMIEWMLDRNGSQIIPAIAQGLRMSPMSEHSLRCLDGVAPPVFERISRLLGALQPEAQERRVADASA